MIWAAFVVCAIGLSVYLSAKTSQAQIWGLCIATAGVFGTWVGFLRVVWE